MRIRDPKVLNLLYSRENGDVCRRPVATKKINAASPAMKGLEVLGGDSDQEDDDAELAVHAKGAPQRSSHPFPKPVAKSARTTPIRPAAGLPRPNAARHVHLDPSRTSRDASSATLWRPTATPPWKPAKPCPLDGGAPAPNRPEPRCCHSNLAQAAPPTPTHAGASQPRARAPRFICACSPLPRLRPKVSRARTTNAPSHRELHANRANPRRPNPPRPRSATTGAPPRPPPIRTRTSRTRSSRRRCGRSSLRSSASSSSWPT